MCKLFEVLFTEFGKKRRKLFKGGYILCNRSSRRKRGMYFPNELCYGLRLEGNRKIPWEGREKGCPVGCQPTGQTFLKKPSPDSFGLHGQMAPKTNEPGQFVLGDQLWGTKCPGTECVREQMRSGQTFNHYVLTLFF
jgi:hypothetical protein